MLINQYATCFNNFGKLNIQDFSVLKGVFPPLINVINKIKKGFAVETIHIIEIAPRYYAHNNNHGFSTDVCLS